MLMWSALFLFVLETNLRSVKGKFIFRILGGSECTFGDFPSQVSIALEGDHICGGSLLNADKILSAAHCFWEIKNVKKLTVLAGDISISYSESPSRQIEKVKNIDLHPMYNPRKTSHAYDIAILTVNKAFQLSSIVYPIQITEKRVVAGTYCVIVGWGVNFPVEEGDDSYYDISYKLLQARVQVFSNAECEKRYKQYYYPDQMICAGDRLGARDACQGDSGGPLICDGVLSGIVSFGTGCGNKDTPGVYTDVAHVSGWIGDTLEMTPRTTTTIPKISRRRMLQAR